jgi:hypothetical protein
MDWLGVTASRRGQFWVRFLRDHRVHRRLSAILVDGPAGLERIQNHALDVRVDVERRRAKKTD